MLNVRRDITVRLAIEPVDFRKSIDGLAIAVGQALGRDPMSMRAIHATPGASSALPRCSSRPWPPSKTTRTSARWTSSPVASR